MKRTILLLLVTCVSLTSFAKSGQPEEPKKIVFSGYEFRCKQYDICDQAADVVKEEKNNEDVPDSSFISNDGSRVEPRFMGGSIAEFTKWVNSRLEYPDYCLKNKIQGRVYIQFTVDLDGTLTDIKVLKSAHPMLDREAVRVVSMSPKWAPAYIDGKPVRVNYTCPINFGLNY